MIQITTYKGEPVYLTSKRMLLSILALLVMFKSLNVQNYMNYSSYLRDTLVQHNITIEERRDSWYYIFTTIGDFTFSILFGTIIFYKFLQKILRYYGEPNDDDHHHDDKDEDETNDMKPMIVN